VRLAWVVVVAACGRIDFDPQTTTITSRSPRAISLGVSHACAIDADSHLWCWGGDDVGEVGNGVSPYDQIPVQIGSDTWDSISANGITVVQSWTCGIKTDNTLWCWGYDNAGQLGLGTSGPPIGTPTQVGAAQWQQVSVGVNCNTCGIQQGGSLWCWGDWSGGICGGFLGNGDTGPALSPVEISPESWSDVAMGDAATCAIKADGTLWCWGINGRHELGDGTARRWITWCPNRSGPRPTGSGSRCTRPVAAGCAGTTSCGAGATAMSRRRASRRPSRSCRGSS
jgi:alpha-tubulin suppressor-like RCC1 family protein